MVQMELPKEPGDHWDEDPYPPKAVLSKYLLEMVCWVLYETGREHQLKVNQYGVEIIFYHETLHDLALEEVSKMTQVSLGKETDDKSWQSYYGNRTVACLSVAEEETTVFLWEALLEPINFFDKLHS